MIETLEKKLIEVKKFSLELSLIDSNKRKLCLSILASKLISNSKKIIEILQRVKIPWNVNYIAQTAASAALCYSDFLEKSRKNIKKENLFLMNSLSKFEWLSCFSSSTNFILIKTKINSKLLQKKLLKKNILVRDCSTFCGLDENYIRIAVKNRIQNKLLVKEFGEIKW